MRILFLFRILFLWFMPAMPPGPGWGEREVHRQGAAMDAKTQSQEAMALEVLDLVNRHRKTLGMPALRLSPIESSVAQKHSSEMASGKTPFGHDGLPAKNRCHFPADRPPQRGSGKCGFWSQGCQIRGGYVVEKPVAPRQYGGSLHPDWNRGIGGPAGPALFYPDFYPLKMGRG